MAEGASPETCRQHIVRKEPRVGQGPPAAPRAIRCCRRAGLCQCGGTVGRRCRRCVCNSAPVERRRRGGHLRSGGSAQGTRLITLLAAACRRRLSELAGRRAAWRSGGGESGSGAAPPAAVAAYFLPPVLGLAAMVVLVRAAGGVAGHPDGPLRHSLLTTVLDGIVSALAFSI